ncbi:RDD family protein [Williamwhitmania taraxaci]|uniref:RDD family protein n=1 Tax=Williamwhitmania taraxaci TaxID=1640674 RepID=A0A1G6JSV2_9BACT|nr:RDD family protein [Williamwhitmania taraxaci]SDC21748.1 RDD family protein [Williamwhitmania taraxaci]
MEKRVGFGIRLGAYLIDLVIAGILASILSIVFAGLFATIGAGVGNASGEEYGAAAGGIVGFIAGLTAGFMVAVPLYFLMEAFLGYTLGKLILGIAIAKEDGTKGDIKDFFLRYAIKNSGTLLALLGLLTLSFIGTLGTIASLAIFVGCFFVLADKKQSFHDMLSKTAVFKKEDIA